MGEGEAFRTVAGRGRAAFEIRGSEFVAVVEPAPDRAAAADLLDEARDAHPDATHHVPCHRVREDGVVYEYQDDDGEPTGSAGKPALNVFVQRELLNVAGVVVRHYGGTNLGVGGLARAYGRAIQDAVADAGTERREPRETITVTVAYDDSGTARSVLESAGVPFEATYEEAVTFEVSVARSGAEALRDRLRSATGGRAEIS